MITLTDIAREAGCSVNTVSRALNGRPDVSPETRVRVRSVADRLGYVPNVLAKSLVTQHTNTLGLVLTDLFYPVYVGLSEAIDALAAERGYQVLLSSTHEDVTRERRAISVLLERRVEGALVVPAGLDAESTAHLRGPRVPVVLVLRNPIGPDVDFVGSDEAAAAGDAVRHLLALGHRRIGFVHEGRPILTLASRLDGYRAAMRAAGVAPSPDWAVTVPFSAEGAYRGTLERLRRPDRPTALLLQSDLLAPGVLAAAREAGLRVPQDLAVVGSGDHYFAPFLETPLTTIRRPEREIAVAAVSRLLERIADPGGAPRQIVIPSALVVRRSCGASRAAAI